MTKKKYIHLGIMLLITLLISICPTIGSLTPLGMRCWFVKHMLHTMQKAF